MIILISGATHTGKTLLAQRMIERLNFPCLSLDHLKMGMIRSGYTDLTVYDDDKLTDYLWPIVREMIKTAIENSQNMIIEGCYIPFDFKAYFDESYLSHIRHVCLVMSEDYIRTHSDDIKNHANAIENRLSDELDQNILIAENNSNLSLCQKYSINHILIDGSYSIDGIVDKLTEIIAAV